MGLIRKRRIVPDHWRPEFASDAADPSALAAGDIIVFLARWVGDRDALLARGGGVGVRLQAGDDLDPLLDGGLHDLQLVDFHFTGFAEGRAYSQARLLRTRHGFRGSVRASGDVSHDRISFMERCGFDEFLIDGVDDPTQVLPAFDEVSLRYQPDASGEATVARERGYRARGARPCGVES